MSNQEIVDTTVVADNLQVVRKEKSLMQIADEAEKMIEAVLKIKKVALKLTNVGDWTDQQGRPYLEGSGSEKIAGPFGISWILLNDPSPEFEDDGHFTFTYRGRFSMGGRTIEVDGSRSSKDPFFKKYDYAEGEGGKKTKTEKPISAIDKRDVKMAAYTNLLGNGVTRILGIRNLTWEDLREFANILQEEVKGIQYGKGGEKSSIKEPQRKNNSGTTPPPTGEKIRTPIQKVSVKEGKTGNKNWIKYTITGLNKDANEFSFSTFDTKLGEEAKRETGTGVLFDVETKPGQYGNELISMSAVEREPGQDG